MALNQHIHAQPLLHARGHAHRAGSTSQQPKQASGKEMPEIFAPGFPMPPTFDDKLEEREYLKGRLAAAFRIFGARGFGKGVSGHISCRDPVEPHTLWLNPFGHSFSTIRRSDLVRVDYEGNVLQGGKYRLINRAAIMIHVAGMTSWKRSISCTRANFPTSPQSKARCHLRRSRALHVWAFIFCSGQRSTNLEPRCMRFLQCKSAPKVMLP